MPAHAVKLGAKAAGIARMLCVGQGAQRTEPLDAALDDVLDAGQRFDVVHHGRLAKQPLDRGKRRLDARPGPFAFETFDQPGFFTADVGRGAAMNVDIQREFAPRIFLPR